MQTNRINAAQVLMSVMAKEKSKISRKVENAGFSSELEAQQREMSAVDSQQTGIAPDEPSNFMEPSQAKENAASEASSRKDDPGPQAEPSEADQGKVAQEKLKKQTYLANQALLEKIMGQLRMTAEARTACEEARDEQGRVSLESLLNILNQDGAFQEALVAEAETSAQDVQELLSSLQMAQGQMVPSLDPQALGLKTAGTYDLDEFTALLNNVVGQIGSKSGKPFVSAQGGSTGVNDSAGELSMASGLTDDPQRILESFLPFSSNGDASGANSSKTLSASLSSSSPVEKDRNEDKNALTQAFDVADASKHLADADAMDVSSFDDLQSIDAQARSESAINSDRLLSSQNESVNVTGIENTDTPETTAATAKPTSQGDSFAVGLFSNSTDGSIQDIGSDELTSTVSGDAEASGAMAEGDAETIADSSGLDSGGDNAIGVSEAGEDNLKVTTAQGSRNSTLTDNNGSKGNGEIFREAIANVKSSHNGASKHIGAFYNSIANSLQHSSNESVNAGTGNTGRLSLSNPAWTQDLSRQIQGLQQQGRSEMTLELEPQNLGRLTLKIEAVNDQITASVSTENEQVKEVLLRNSSALRQQLQQDGLSLGQLQVDVRRERSSGRDFGQNEAQQLRGRGVGRVGDIEERTPSASNGVYRKRAENQLISLFA